MDTAKQFSTYMYAIAQVLNIELKPETIRMYYQILKEHDLNKVNVALNSILIELYPGQKFPTPRQIIEKFKPVIDDESQAKEAASRIVESVSRFGWNNIDRARAWIGELGWAVVQRQGGWIEVCTTLSHNNIGILQAQWRELAKSMCVRARQGLLDIPPDIPKAEKKGEMISFAGLIRKIDEVKKKD